MLFNWVHCSSALQYSWVYCRALQQSTLKVKCSAVYCSAVQGNILQCRAGQDSILQCSAVWCSGGRCGVQYLAPRGAAHVIWQPPRWGARYVKHSLHYSDRQLALNSTQLQDCTNEPREAPNDENIANKSTNMAIFFFLWIFFVLSDWLKENLKCLGKETTLTTVTRVTTGITVTKIQTMQTKTPAHIQTNTEGDA